MMENGIKISSENPAHDAANTIADALCKIMGSGAEQETIREAIRAFSTTVKIENITIEGAHIDNRTITVD